MHDVSLAASPWSMSGGDIDNLPQCSAANAVTMTINVCDTCNSDSRANVNSVVAQCTRNSRQARLVSSSTRREVDERTHLCEDRTIPSLLCIPQQKHQRGRCFPIGRVGLEALGHRVRHPPLIWFQEVLTSRLHSRFYQRQTKSMV